ncbi:PLP-dependent transferase [Aquibium sp. LZ166]|uniref:PLP-dependent transferase n=1 Tax=Aquibium pacificus TaxID=3153579 RepID=A0ABV3SS31_9HYPH
MSACSYSRPCWLQWTACTPDGRRRSTRPDEIATRVLNTEPASSEGFSSLSIPTHRGSTIVYPDYESFAARGKHQRHEYTYGLAGTPTTRTLQNRLTELESAHDTFLTPSGLSAITTVFLAVCSPGDRVLIPDNVYPPVRRFADGVLARLGIVAVYYDPRIAAAPIEAPERLRLVWIEAPGSTTIEIPDFGRLHTLARTQGALIGYDNSWATPLLHRPLEQGADIVVEALTKYLTGHSDLLMGSISVASEELACTVHAYITSLGLGVSPDDCFLALRGMETASVRLAHVGFSALWLAEQLQSAAPVDEVLHPGLPTFNGHRCWRKRSFGTSGLFTVVLKPEDLGAFRRRFDSLSIFRLGASWGGTHSLLAPVFLDRERSLDRSYARKPLLRISSGLEAKEDLLEDLMGNVFA